MDLPFGNTFPGRIELVTLGATSYLVKGKLFIQKAFHLNMVVYTALRYFGLEKLTKGSFVIQMMQYLLLLFKR